MRCNVLLLTVICGCLLVCGCETVKDASLTGRLWNEHDFCVPSPQPKLTLLATTNDVLVEYDEERESDGTIRRRGYLLNVNVSAITSGHKPLFIKGESPHCSPIPILNLPPSDQAKVALYAVSKSTNGYPFTLHRDGRDFGPYDLPVYPDKRETATQVVLTPLTVTGDVSIVGAVVGYYMFPMFASWFGTH